MKIIELETSKGKFVLIDKNNDWCFGEKFNYYGKNNFDALNIVNANESFSYSKSFKISEITEEQASEIVDFEDGCRMLYGYAKNKLNSLLKSKGIYLYDNPYDLNEQLDCNCDMCYQKLEDAFDESEQKTFYNPYIFKL